MASSQNTLFAQANSFAMLHGLYFGLLGILSLVFFRIGITHLWSTWLGYLVVLISPIVAILLTRRFRHAVMPPATDFSFGRAYVHSLLMGFYSGFIVAAFVAVYMNWFDHGGTFDAYQAMLAQPDIAAQMEISGMNAQVALMTGGKTMHQVVEEMREIPPAHYAASLIYMNLFVAPVLSLVVAAFTRKS